MTVHSLQALQNYEDARAAASAAECAMWDVKNSKDSALIDARYKDALAAAYALKAAKILLGLDPVLAHPTREREVDAQCDAAEISPFYRKKRLKKKNECNNR